MNIKIEFNIDNDVFQDASASEQIREVLKDAANTINSSGLKANGAKLRDANGNTVGTIAITEE